MRDDLEVNYANAYANRLGFGKKPALILVDFVRAYFDRDCELYANVENELASALLVREAARAAAIDVPIIFTNVIYSIAPNNGGRFFEKVIPLRNFVIGNSMGEWAEGLTPGNDEIVISKQYPSAFFGTSLASMLTAKGIDTLIITGLTTSGCVRATCVDCISHGFIPIIVRDACGDRHESPHNASLFDINAKYGDVISQSEAIGYLRMLSQEQG